MNTEMEKHCIGILSDSTFNLSRVSVVWGEFYIYMPCHKSHQDNRINSKISSPHELLQSRLHCRYMATPGKVHSSQEHILTLGSLFSGTYSHTWVFPNVLCQWTNDFKLRWQTVISFLILQ